MTIHINLLETALAIIASYCLIMPILLYGNEIKQFFKQKLKSPPEITSDKNPKQAKPEDIMGKSLPSKSQILHESATNDMEEDKSFETSKKENIFDPSKEKAASGMIPEKQLDKAYSKPPEELNIDVDTEEKEQNKMSKEDLEEENEEFQKYNVGGNGEFSSGVSFGELGTVHKVITSDKITKQDAVDATIAVQKIENTEMYNQLISNIEGAEKKVQSVMENILYGKKSDILFYEVESVDDFDIWKAIG